MGRKRAAAWALVMLTAWSCAGAGEPEVTMSEYTVEAPAEVVAGSVTLTVRNLGAIDHELVVLRSTRAADDLPVDDSEVQVDARGIREIGATKTIQAGGETTLTLRLQGGRYALICNVPGHYQSGMYTALRVV